MSTGPGFIFGGDTGVSSPQELARKRALVQALLSSQRTPRNVGEGLSALGDGIAANMLNRKADKAERTGLESAQNAFAPILESLGVGGSPNAPAAAGSAAPLDMSGNEVFSGFMDTVKSGVTNPYALAAIAATGKHESGFDPKNATRTWDDPSQSGQPGRAGGIMSWRGPRYDALAAAGDLSPAGQAKFFLQENPQLIEALNSAKSVDEAVSLMNNAWKFAGYNQSGGEAAARLATARSLLSTFEGGAAQNPVQVASLDPSIGLPEEQQTAGLFVGTPDELVGSRLPAQAPIPQPAPTDAWAGMREAQPGQQVAQALTQQPAQQQQAAPSGGPSLAQLLAAASNPWLPEGQQEIVRALIGQKLKENDPATALERRKLELELRNLENPPSEYGFMELPDGTVIRTDKRSGQASEAFKGQPKVPESPTEVREYQFYVDQELAAGREPQPYNDWRLQGKKAGATNITNNVGGEQLTPGQKKIDEAFADTYLAWNSGGFADSRKQIEQLGEAIKILESGENVTGVIGALPPQLAPFFNKEGTIARENVEEVVQRSLREILGAQFTEKEGERLISRAFNPLLKPPENAKRVRRLLTTIGSMADAKQDMVNYFDENGTLRGYRGSRPTASQLEKLANEFGKNPDEKDEKRGNRTSSGVEWSIDE